VQLEGAPGGAPDWVDRYVDRATWEAIQPFDRTNDLHLELVASALHHAFLIDNDPQAYQRLVELMAPRLATLAEDIAQEQGLLKPAEDLAAAFFSRIFIDTSRPSAPVGHFLAHAAERIRGEAEAWVRDFAMADTAPAPPSKTAGYAAADPSAESIGRDYATLVQTCFHRLDVEQRRVLRAKDVQGLDIPQLAERFGWTRDEALEQLSKARFRLNELVARAMGGDPMGGDA
jgi:DNA-directed RNA polymerase specialized sigma24 family protein